MTVTGHEDEFRRLFAAEASARLDELDRLTGQLVDAPRDPDRLDTMFRQVHTIKGGAATVGYFDLAGPVESLGTLIEELRSGARVADAAAAAAIRGAAADLRERIAGATRDL